MGCTVQVLTVAESSSFGWRRPAERLNSHPASQNRPAPPQRKTASRPACNVVHPLRPHGLRARSCVLWVGVSCSPTCLSCPPQRSSALLTLPSLDSPSPPSPSATFALQGRLSLPSSSERSDREERSTSRAMGPSCSSLLPTTTRSVFPPPLLPVLAHLPANPFLNLRDLLSS